MLTLELRDSNRSKAFREKYFKTLPNVRKLLKQIIPEKFFLHFENNLRNYEFRNFEENLKANVWKIFRRTILRKFGATFVLNFRNNLRKQGFKHFMEIDMYSEILRKFEGNVKKNLKTEDFEEIFPTYWK